MTVDSYKLGTNNALERVKIYYDTLNDLSYICDAKIGSALTDNVWKVRKVFSSALFTSPIYANTTDTNGVSKPQNVELRGPTRKSGVRISVNNNCKLATVNFSSGTTAVNCYLYNSGITTILSQTTVSGTTATFDYDLVAGTTYWILFDSGGVSGKRVDTNIFISANYPINRTNINYTYGYWDAGTHPTMLPGIDSIVTSVLSVPGYGSGEIYYQETDSYNNPATDLATVQSLIYS